MSSRTLAAAKARRAGENAPPISGSMPRTSIGSHAAFVPPGYQTQLPAPNSNIRVAKSNMPPPQQNIRRQPQASAYQQQQQQPHPPPPSNGLPFTKLSVSDAIGLITLRLGRVEQWLIENDHEEKEHGDDAKEIMATSKIMDQSVLSGLLERLENIEKREEPVPSSSSALTSLELQEMKEEIQKIADAIALMQKEGNRQSVLISKQAEKNLKMEREVVETKDLLKTFMIKYDLFASEVNERFADYEQAIAELEKNIPVVTTTSIDDLLPPLQEEVVKDQEENIQVEISEVTNVMDLKTMVETALN